jgi:hypothetical protein
LLSRDGNLKEGEPKDYIAMVYRVPQNLLNPAFEFQFTNLCKIHLLIRRTASLERPAVSEQSN